MGQAATAAYDRAVRAREAEADLQSDLVERIAEQREEHRQAWEDSEVAEVHREIARAEHIMRLPTPEAHEELGTPESDPLRGPSS